MCLFYAFNKMVLWLHGTARIAHDTKEVKNLFAGFSIFYFTMAG